VRTSPIRDRLVSHLGEDATTLPVVADSFMPWDHVNVQVAVEAYLTNEGRTVRADRSYRAAATLTDPSSRS
jgi:hypothetical protein